MVPSPEYGILILRMEGHSGFFKALKWAAWLGVVMLSGSGVQAQEKDWSMPFPRVMVAVMYEGYMPVDTAVARLYDAGHNYLGEYCLATDAWGILEIADTACIVDGAKYFVEVSKPGYKTVEVECYATNDRAMIARSAILVPAGCSRIVMIIVGVIVITGGAWWFIRRRKRLTVNE